MHYSIVQTIEDAGKLLHDYGYRFTYNTNESELSCVYYPTAGNPEGCFVGALLGRLGVDRNLIPAGQLVAMSADVLTYLQSIDVWFDNAAILFLAIVQTHQDREKQWGFCWQQAIASLTPGTHEHELASQILRDAPGVGRLAPTLSQSFSCSDLPDSDTSHASDEDQKSLVS